MNGSLALPSPVLGHNVSLYFQCLTTAVSIKLYLLTRWKAKVEKITNIFSRSFFLCLTKRRLISHTTVSSIMWSSSLHLPGHESEKQKTLSKSYSAI